MPRFPSRRQLLRLLPAALIALLASASSAPANFVTIDFDTTPALALAPTTFSTAQQVVTVPGLATVGGGTLVSTPTFLFSFAPGGGSRNAYGTRSGTAFGYLPNLTINFDPANIVTRVQGTLFNGITDLNSYTVTAFNGASAVASQTFADVPDNLTATGFRNWDLAAASITRLVITPDTSFSGGAFNYFIDNVGVTFTPLATVPEPASILSMAVGLAFGCGRVWRRRSGLAS